MRSASSGSAYTPSQPVQVSLLSGITARLADYLELTKPRISVLVLLTVTVGYTLGGSGNWYLAGLLHALFGIALVASGSSALNQFLERTTDAKMTRTAQRPLPAGRLQPIEVLLFGFATGTLGTIYLAIMVNLLTAILAAITFLLYTAIYTPLKRKTSLCTAIGAIPGALPPVLGWTAAGSPLDSGAFSLFAVLFVWQFPHFLAIAWLYREQYAQAGLRMLPSCFPSPRVTGFMCVAYSLVLIPISILPRQFALAGNTYLLVAMLLGAGYLICSFRFLIKESVQTARGLLWSSLIYLPVLLIALTWDHLQLLR